MLSVFATRRLSMTLVGAGAAVASMTHSSGRTFSRPGYSRYSRCAETVVEM